MARNSSKRSEIVPDINQGARGQKAASQDKFKGCLLGLALGDALGAPYEGGPIERLVWRIIGKTKQREIRFTDDTQMSLDIAESIITLGRLDPTDLAARFAQSYRWSRGYGPGMAKLLKKIRKGNTWNVANRSVYPDGSYGNGAAMRAPVVGLFYAYRLEELSDAASLSASITHAHPLGMEGAVLLSFAVALALKTKNPTEIIAEAAKRCKLPPFSSKLELASRWLESHTVASAREVREQLGNWISAIDSCVTAVYISLRFLGSSFVKMLEFVRSCGGDVDTIGAMAGAVWGAANGYSTLPNDKLTILEQHDRLVMAAEELHKRAQG